MTLWLAAAILVLIVVVPLLLPLLRPPRDLPGRLEHDIEVYRDQLREIDVDLQRGAISESEAAEARREIERRILKAADAGNGETRRPSSQSAVTAVALALMVPGAGLLTYGYLGSPSQPSRPFAERAGVRAPMVAQSSSGGGAVAQAQVQAQAQSQPQMDRQAPDLETMAARLADKLKDNPDSPQDWALLGRTYWQLGQFDNAANALRQAVALRGDVAALQSAYGEALTQAADGQVIPEALVAFRRANDLDGTHAGARFYLALAARQAGDAQAAYDGWLSLVRELPADNPGRGAVLAQLQSVAAELGIDLAEALEAPSTPPASGPVATAPERGPTREDMEAAAQMSAQDRMAMIRSMVEGLAARMEENPDDVDGWARLGRAYGVLGEREKAIAAYRRALALLPVASSGRRQIEQAIEALGG